MTTQRIGFCASVIFSLVFYAQNVRADGTPGEMLARMSAAMRQLDYQGSFIYEHDGRIDTLRVFHRGGKEERERLVSLNGAPREIVRTDETVTCIQPERQPLVFALGSGRRLVPLVPDAAAEQWQNNYTLQLGGEERIAGHAAQLLEVRARDAFRYSYRLWLEKSSGLLVRSMLLGVDQRPLQQFMFVALDIGATPSEADLTPSVAASGASTEAASPAEVSVTPASQWSVTDAPVGFALTARRQPFDGKNGSVEHLVFSDGLASVSVYLEPVATVPGLLTKGLVSRGALSVYARSFNGFQVTVLGEVPPVTVERIAQSLHQGEQSSGK